MPRPKRCKSDMCDRDAETRGWCKMHYERWRRANPDNVVRHRVQASECRVAGCDIRPLARDLCPTHYARWRKGLPLDAPVLRQGLSLAERLWRMVDRTGGPDACWPWTGAVGRPGYGRIVVTHGHSLQAHRLAYELLVEPIPAGKDLDHTCHSFDLTCPGGDGDPHRRCCNPAHLEPVDRVVNVRRGRSPAAANVAKTHCPQGHPYSGDNLYINAASGGRVCRICVRAHQRAYMQRRQAAGKAAG